MSAATETKRVSVATGSGKKRIGWHIAVALADRGSDIAVHYRTSRDDASETVQSLRDRGVFFIPAASTADPAINVQSVNPPSTKPVSRTALCMRISAPEPLLQSL
jgi:NAD(P)-dependent dehydrogenase (short-subunit alcohol dehydrogenase family)